MSWVLLHAAKTALLAHEALCGLCDHDLPCRIGERHLDKVTQLEDTVSMTAAEHRDLFVEA